MAPPNLKTNIQCTNVFIKHWQLHKNLIFKTLESLWLLWFFHGETKTNYSILSNINHSIKTRFLALSIFSQAPPLVEVTADFWSRLIQQGHCWSLFIVRLLLCLMKPLEFLNVQNLGFVSVSVLLCKKSTSGSIASNVCSRNAGPNLLPRCF